MTKRINKIVFGIIISSLIISSCYKHEEGCRDLNASNYDVFADTECELPCCKYNTVSFNLELINDTSKVDTSFFYHESGDSIKINLLRMYVSNFALTNNKNEKYRLNQEINLGVIENSQLVYHKYNYTSVKLKNKSSNVNIGTLNKLDSYKTVEFIFGIDSFVNHSAIDKIDKSNSLSPSTDSMYLDKVLGYYFLKLEIEFKDNTKKLYTILGDKNLRKLSLSGNINFEKRESHTLHIELDVNKWFKDINFNSNSNDIKLKLLSNLNRSFIISE